MTEPPARHQLAHYPFHCPLSTRYADMDMWQHLNNASLIGLHGEAVQAWFNQALGADSWRPPTAGPVLALQHSATDFIAESHYPAPLQAGVRLLARGPQGITLASALFQHGRCVGLHRSHWSAWLEGPPADMPAALLAALPEVLPDVLPDAGPAADAPPPDIPALAAMPWRRNLATRFGDIDARGLASDASLARLAEQLRVAFLSDRLGDLRAANPNTANTGFMVGHVSLRWLRRPARPPAAWQAGARVSRVGARSLGLQGGLYDEAGHCHALADSVLVCIDRHTRRSTALPDALRACLTDTAPG